ncbi:carbonic anhydrase like protein [Zymoseptoria brevis]|uniref:Carbonic anhydrase like protein n=1 Tax=Zymoseptoria brevis TaxID=1047168 RepID=A0A0F4GNL1_9PEZI|nr:carbonic anhydrase like protein [Zymoseptoria brevis]
MIFSRASNLAAVVAATFSGVFACPEHDFHAESKRTDLHIKKRADDAATEWAYEASYNWGELSENYTLCQAGTQQAPIPLLLTQGLSLVHQPDFYNYSDSINGSFYNWGYGPAMTLSHPEDDYTTLPSFTFDDGTIGDGNETVYMTGWHIHAPADHSVGGQRSKAELHYVHVDAAGNPRAVLAFRIDPGNSDSAFFRQLPEFISFRNTDMRTNMTDFNPFMALQEVNKFSEFWTYRGSLTSPPCTEGIRFYLARNILFVSVEQMQAILAVSTYSARAEQQVWQHQINA